MKKHLNTLKNFFKIAYVLFSYKVLKPINNFVLQVDFMLDFTLKIRYKKLLNKLHQDNLKKGYKMSFDEIVKSIKQVYRMMPFQNRMFVKSYIISCFSVDEASTQLIKMQGRNEKCNCGSGLKFKKCCWKKYQGIAG